LFKELFHSSEALDIIFLPGSKSDSDSYRQCPVFSTGSETILMMVSKQLILQEQAPYLPTSTHHRLEVFLVVNGQIIAFHCYYGNPNTLRSPH
jgi:hypothetical protein